MQPPEDRPKRQLKQAGDSYRGRLAPSPTGLLHLGHARTFLVAFLRARKLCGKLLLRIEDLDTPRVVAGAEDQILRDLEWLGLNWDEGPIRQSDRTAIYEAALLELEKKGWVYPCTCTRREIATLASAPHNQLELGDPYPGTCRGGPTHRERVASTRFLAPERSPPYFDSFRGKLCAPSSPGDFVVRRADGIWAYQFAVALDDAEMGVSEVVRGLDLASSTPRQVAILEALGKPLPNYFHVPLVVDRHGERLSKRHSSLSIKQLREAGWTPQLLLAWLGKSLGLTSAKSVPIDDLLFAFDPGVIGEAPIAVPEELALDRAAEHDS